MKNISLIDWKKVMTKKNIGIVKNRNEITSLINFFAFNYCLFILIYHRKFL
jgi:hypothetical protein